MRIYAEETMRSVAIDTAAPILTAIDKELPLFEEPEIFASLEGLVRIKLVSRAASVDFATIDLIGRAAHAKGAISWIHATSDEMVAIAIQKNVPR